MRAAEEWARGFFSGTFVDLWLRAISETQTRDEADFLESELQLPPGGRVMDLACGGGRLSLELAARGYRPTGVDLSDDFLAAARAAASARSLDVAWEQRSILDLPWVAEFDGAFCMGNSLGGLDSDDLTAFFGAVALALKPGARFVIDHGVIAESILPNMKDRPWWQLGDIHFLVHNTYDAIRSRLNMEFTIIRDGEIETKTGFSQVHTHAEFCRLLADAGFQRAESHASIAREPFQLGSHRLLLVTTRDASA